MAHFNIHTANLEPDGPVIVATIGLSPGEATSRRQHALHIPRNLRVRALIDTGWRNEAAIADSVVKHLGIQPFDYEVVTTATDPKGRLLNKYKIDIHFENDLPFTVTAVSAPIDSQGFKLIIGRALMVHSHFSYDGPTQRFTFDI